MPGAVQPPDLAIDDDISRPGTGTLRGRVRFRDGFRRSCSGWRPDTAVLRWNLHVPVTWMDRTRATDHGRTELAASRVQTRLDDGRAGRKCSDPAAARPADAINIPIVRVRKSDWGFGVVCTVSTSHPRRARRNGWDVGWSRTAQLPNGRCGRARLGRWMRSEKPRIEVADRTAVVLPDLMHSLVHSVASLVGRARRGRFLHVHVNVDGGHFVREGPAPVRRRVIP